MSKFKIGDKVRLGAKARKWIIKKYGNKTHTIRFFGISMYNDCREKTYSFNNDGKNPIYSYELVKVKD